MPKEKVKDFRGVSSWEEEGEKQLQTSAEAVGTKRESDHTVKDEKPGSHS